MAEITNTMTIALGREDIPKTCANGGLTVPLAPNTAAVVIRGVPDLRLGELRAKAQRFAALCRAAREVGGTTPDANPLREMPEGWKDALVELEGAARAEP